MLDILSKIAEIIIAIFAVVGSFIAIFQGIEIRKYNRMCFLPNISDHIEVEDGYFKYELINSGPGVACIQDLIVTVDGQKIVAEGKTIINLVFEKLFSPKYSYEIQKWGMLGYSATLAPKDKFLIAEVAFNNKKIPSQQELQEEIKKRVDIIIKYQSIYGKLRIFDTKIIKSHTRQ